MSLYGVKVQCTVHMCRRRQEVIWIGFFGKLFMAIVGFAVGGPVGALGALNVVNENTPPGGYEVAATMVMIVEYWLARHHFSQ